MRGPMPRPLEAKIWNYVRQTATCWLWTASTNKGYALLKDGRKNIAIHRWMYEHFVGPIPDGLDLDHLCRVRHCVNPAHLEAVTRGVNVLRGATVAAENGYKTHCIRGHEFTPENTWINTDQFVHRSCKQCQADRAGNRVASGVCRRCPNTVDLERSARYCTQCLNDNRDRARAWREARRTRETVCS